MTKIAPCYILWNGDFIFGHGSQCSLYFRFGLSGLIRRFEQRLKRNAKWYHPLMARKLTAGYLASFITQSIGHCLEGIQKPSKLLHQDFGAEYSSVFDHKTFHPSHFVYLFRAAQPRFFFKRFRLRDASHVHQQLDLETLPTPENTRGCGRKNCRVNPGRKNRMRNKQMDVNPCPNYFVKSL